MAQPTADDLIIRPFADWLREQSHGHTHEEMGEALHDLVARVLETGKAGTVQLTIKVKPMEDSPDSPLLTASGSCDTAKRSTPRRGAPRT